MSGVGAGRVAFSSCRKATTRDSLSASRMSHPRKAQGHYQIHMKRAQRYGK